MTQPATLATLADTGISLGSAITGAGVWTGVLAFLGIVWKNKVPMRKLGVDAEERLREDLMTQLNKKDGEFQVRYDALEKRLEAMRSGYEKKLEAERATHSAEMAIVRHRMNNLDQCLSMMLVLIEENPDKAKGIALWVREMRDRQEKLESEEKSRIAAARIASVQQEEAQDGPL